MGWNYRIIRHKYENQPSHFWYGIHEVYYDDKGNPTSCTTNPIDLTIDDDYHEKFYESKEPVNLNVSEVKHHLEEKIMMILKDMDRHEEILNYEDF